MPVIRTSASMSYDMVECADCGRFYTENDGEWGGQDFVCFDCLDAESESDDNDQE